MPEPRQSIIARKAQEAYCWEKKVPMYAPADGLCPHCGANIYAGDSAISPDMAGLHLITGCQYCHTSFVD